FEQCRGQTGRKVWWMRLVGERTAPRDRTRALAEEQAEEVFLLFDLPLQIDDGRTRAEHQLLGLPHVHQRGGAAALANPRDTQRFFARCERSRRDAELEGGREQLVVP